MHIYATPKVYLGKHYMPLVDLWSLALLCCSISMAFPKKTNQDIKSTREFQL
jgi:hypothetical protein